MMTEPPAEMIERACAAYNEVWQSWVHIDTTNVDECRRAAMIAALDAALTERALARKEALEEAAMALRGLAFEYKEPRDMHVESMTVARAVVAVLSLIEQPGGGN